MAKKKQYNVVAVSLYPGAGRVRETDFIKADEFKYDGEGNVSVLRGDQVVATYLADSIKGVRMSCRKFRTDKVTFVRRFVRESSPLSLMLGDPVS